MGERDLAVLRMGSVSSCNELGMRLPAEETCARGLFIVSSAPAGESCVQVQAAPGWSGGRERLWPVGREPNKSGTVERWRIAVVDWRISRRIIARKLEVTPIRARAWEWQ